MDLTQFKLPANPVDYFRSVYLYPPYYLKYMEEQGTVFGYDGPHSLDLVPFVFEGSEKKELALQDARNFVSLLAAVYSVDPGQLIIAFSGVSGFHVMLPEELFGSLSPSRDLPFILYHLATKLADGFKTFSPNVCLPDSEILLTNSAASETGLHKILLSSDELLECTVEGIRELARNARPRVELFPRSELSPNALLRELFLNYSQR